MSHPPSARATTVRETSSMAATLPRPRAILAPGGRPMTLVVSLVALSLAALTAASESATSETTSVIGLPPGASIARGRGSVAAMLDVSRTVVALALGGWLMGSAAQAADKTVVLLGTATPGGGFPVYGAAVVDTINEIDSMLAIEPQNTKGSTENVPLLEAGRLDIALVQGEVVHEALDGIGRPPAKLKILVAMY